MKFKMVINVIIAAARGFLANQAVAAAIKEAAIEAMLHGEWDRGEKTAFVIEAGRKVVAATPNKFDDFLYPILADLYVRKYLNGTEGDDNGNGKPDIYSVVHDGLSPTNPELIALGFKVGDWVGESKDRSLPQWCVVHYGELMPRGIAYVRDIE